jgi:hypothetical protein
LEDVFYNNMNFEWSRHKYIVAGTAAAVAVVGGLYFFFSRGEKPKPETPKQAKIDLTPPPPEKSNPLDETPPQPTPKPAQNRSVQFVKDPEIRERSMHVDPNLSEHAE